ncbi:MAG TPA: ABC transporter ATP-binding protein [Rhizomicrobium sp.]|nr:ABC transporter ATP-binding protein [Rhizomicrobium sp.]
MGFLSVSAISKAFGGTPVVDGVSLEVARGEFFALLGPSGCGKTTLLRMIAGFETPDSGGITIDGADMTAVPPHLRPTNMVFQSYAIFPHLNVFDNIAYGLRKLRLPKAELIHRVEAMLATVRLDGMGGRAADQLSGGQRQRVALARALVRQPKILLLDEPLGALDKRLREQMQVELRLLQKKIGITFLLVTHDQEEALSLSDRIAVMSGGKVLQVAGPRDLYERPNCREVADFIGEINFFPATVKAVSPADVTVNGGVLGVVTLPRANAPDAVAAGDAVLLAIRPEHLRFAAPGESGVAGAVIAATYLGERSHVHVKLPSRSEPVAVSAAAPPADSSVQLVFPPQRLMALPSAG